MHVITALRFAGPIAVVLICGLSVQSASADAWTCPQLHEAAFLDEPDEVREVLAHGVDVDCTDVLGQTALVTAVNGASMASFDVLMQSGARVDVRTEFGQSLLQHTKKKFSSVDHQKGLEQYRALYKTMIARLQTAGAAN
ncbi:ankyrin repeat domain-containing protein [Magnetovibrio sp.]|uniref:ankyrin repeat domain-containing protein n=1 Tax=Magnetovibrio sp. TaxID=2024836 RepID=UPI002F93ABCD